VDILDDMGVSKLSAKVFFKLNYSCEEFTLVQSCLRMVVFACCSLCEIYPVDILKYCLNLHLRSFTCSRTVTR